MYVCCRRNPASPSPTTPVSMIATPHANGETESTERNTETAKLVSGKPSSNIRSRAPGQKVCRSLSYESKDDLDIPSHSSDPVNTLVSHGY